MTSLRTRNVLGIGTAIAMLLGALMIPVPALAQDSSHSGQRSSAPSASSSELDALRNLLKSTTKDKLTPLASGYKADDSGTAPYSSFITNGQDITALNKARDAAQKIVDDPDTTTDEIARASSNLKEAFDSVRFIYTYTGVTGTNGARLYDNNGNLIQAHGAGLIRAKTSTLAKEDQYIDHNKDGYVYILCGEDKTDRLVAHGVRIYYSDDLMNWIDKGLGFQTYQGDQDLRNKLNGADPTYQKYYNVDNIANDPDYTNIYGKDFSIFANDPSNYDISSPQEALDKLLWDLKALYGDGSNPAKTSCVFERPKMVYNAHTKRWVIWFHADGPQYGNEDTATYSKAKAGVAVSITSNPAGPYKYLGSFRMSPGTNADNPGMARDLSLYVDQGKDGNGDGADDAYLIYASNENRDLTISLLDSTYTKLVKPVSEQKRGTSVKDGDTYNIIATNSKESPAPVKWNGHYYLIYSHTTGWAPNENEYTKSEGDNIMGPYHEIGTPFVDGNGYEQSHTNSFYTQSSAIVPFDEKKGIFFYWGDRWFNPDTGNDISQSRYVMTPMQFVNGQMRVLPADDWSTDDVGRYAALDVLSTIPDTAGSVSDVIAKLPSRLEIQVAGSSTTTTTPVTWDTYFGPDQPSGDVALTGVLPEFGDAPVSFTVTIYPKSTYLFIDAGSDPDNESDYFTQLKRVSDSVSRQDHSDQMYTKNDGWGLVSKLGVAGDVQKANASSNDVYETGLYANSGKSIIYQADLDPGVYTVQAGMKDWWAQWNDRTVTFSVVSGSTQYGITSVNLKNGQKSTSGITFTLVKKTPVQFVVSNGGTSLDPVLSWISVSKADPSEVQKVASVGTVAFYRGQKPRMPNEVTVSKADGSTEQRTVTWLNVKAPTRLYSPVTVQGVVKGTTLPATATIQMFQTRLEYFIDVNGSDVSPTFLKAKELNGDLINTKADQAFDETTGWGNSSQNYGVELTGDADPYRSGIYAGADGNSGSLAYVMTLSPGNHTISVGMHDWWGQTRPTTITYQYPGMTTAETLATGDVTSDGVILEGDVVIPDGVSKTVTITLSSSQGTGPVVSWLSSTKNTSPRILGANAIRLALGDAFDPRKDVTASDDQDGDLTEAITITGSVDVSTAGTYDLVYSVMNSHGLSTSVRRVITVLQGPVVPGGPNGNDNEQTASNRHGSMASDDSTARLTASITAKLGRTGVAAMAFVIASIVFLSVGGLLLVMRRAKKTKRS